MAKKRKKKFSALLWVFLILIIAIFMTLAYPSYISAKEAIGEIDKLNERINKIIPDTINDDINLSLVEGDFWNIEWSTSDETVLSKDGICHRPLYEEGNKTVVVRADYVLKDLGTFDRLVFKMLNVESGYFEKNVTIEKLAMTDLDKVKEIIQSLDVPKTVIASMNFPTEVSFYPEMIIAWKSFDSKVLDNKGNVLGVGETKVEATVTLGKESLSKTFDVKVLDEIVFEEINYDFSEYEDSTYAQTTYDKIILSSSLAENEKVKFKTNENDAYLLTNGQINSLKKISFSYQYASDVSYTKDTFIKLLLSKDNINFEEVKQEILKDGDIHNFVYENENSGNYYIKVLITSEYKNAFVLLDDLIITRNLCEEDIISSTAFPTSVKNNILLPFTTSYGGVLEITSSSSRLTSGGVVTSGEDSELVTMDVLVKGFPFEVNFSKDIKVLGTKYVTPVEIRFIDVGKYGHSDCGESILIKYGDIEVLIDAGDRYSDSFKAVKEVIDSNMTDGVLEYVIATHPDSDHIGGMDDVILEYDVRNIIRFNGTASSEIYHQFDEAAKNEENCNVCTALDSYNNVGSCKRIITLGEDVYIEIINTYSYEQTENNARSIVCVLNAYGYRTLFTGDADNKVSELEKAYMDAVGDVDILKMVHHGTKEGTTSEYLNIIKPEVVVVCNGNYFGNKHGHPTYEAINRVYEYSSDTKVYAVVGGDADDCAMTSSGSYKCNPTDYMVDRNGTILITIDSNGYDVSSEYFGNNPIEIRDTAFWEARAQ